MSKKILSLLITAGLFVIVMLYSCEKDIKINIPNAPTKIVVEAWIDLNDYPIVLLTKSLPFFGTIDSAMLASLIIQDATVVVSDGFSTDTLAKIFDPNYLPYIQYKGTKIKGVAGRIYSLTVKDEGQTLTATTTIPPPIPLDSAWFKVQPSMDSLGYVWATFTDPPQPGNYYRIFTKRLSIDKIFIPELGSVYEDRFFNGQTLTFSILRGPSSNISPTSDPEATYYKKGETIIIKTCTIDQVQYNFWRSAENEVYGGGNPFVNPSQIPTNINGGGLGVWGGYGCSFDTVIAK
ncbi:MAG: DUF4249 domain-containing protein [Bacteroidales bacterium]|jgi:Domain of unknown function (DUF4249)